MCADMPEDWVKWLPLAEWCYNTSYHNTIRTSLYEIVYSQPPPLHLPYLPNESTVALVDKIMQKREEKLKLLKFHMQRVQNRMKQIADRRRSERKFERGDLVMVKLHAYRQVSVTGRRNAKLAPKYQGPFTVIEPLGAVAYKIQLPAGSQIHNVFHVSQLKKFLGSVPPNATSTNVLVDEGQKEPEYIVDRMTVRRGNKVVTKVLVK